MLHILASKGNELLQYKYIRKFFYVLLTVHLSIFIPVINQLDAQNFCFTISLFHASTCFEHMCLWHRHTHSCDDARGCVMQFYLLMMSTCARNM